MAKKISMTKMVQHAKETAAQAALIPDETPARRPKVDLENPYAALSTALRKNEVDELNKWAEDNKGTRGSLLTALMRYAMREVRAGRVKLKTEKLKFTDIK